LVRKLVAGVAIGLTAAVITLVLSRAGLLAGTELATYDWRIRASADPASLRDDIVIVEVNDTSIRDLAPFVGRWAVAARGVRRARRLPESRAGAGDRVRFRVPRAGSDAQPRDRVAGDVG
jgi:hypothetical protein